MPDYKRLSSTHQKVASAQEIKEALQEKGITRVVFIRHANAAPPAASGMKAKDAYDTPHDWKMDDQMRPITDKGKAQAEEARRWFLEGIGLENCRALVASGARRATETLQIMAGERHADGTGDVSILMLPSLHPAGISPTLEGMFDRINYAPLKRYYQEPGGASALDEYSVVVAEEFITLVKNLDSSKKGNTLACFGHALFANAVAKLVGEAMGLSKDDIAALSEIDLGESEGISIQAPGQDAGGEGKMVLRHMHCRYLASSSVSSHPLFS